MITICKYLLIVLLLFVSSCSAFRAESQNFSHLKFPVKVIAAQNKGRPNYIPNVVVMDSVGITLILTDGAFTSLPNNQIITLGTNK